MLMRLVRGLDDLLRIDRFLRSRRSRELRRTFELEGILKCGDYVYVISFQV